MNVPNQLIYAVVVTYYPNEATLVPLLKLLSNQLDHVVIVDNTPKNDDRLAQQFIRDQFTLNQFSIVRLGGNLGIATALNVGIELALAEGATHVLLSDQDSLPASDMVSGLLQSLSELQSNGVRMGAIGPTFTDLHTQLTYPFQAEIPGRFFYGHRTPTADEPYVEAITLITSGTLIPVEVLQHVGLMREDFFIDFVDTEWCHRARSQGYQLFGTGAARMYQRMGEDRLRVWYLRWRYESAYSPLRIYYRLRNFVVLWKLNYISWRWKIRSSWYPLGIVYSHVVFGKQRVACLGKALKGAWHGLIGRMGRYRP
ncbi:MAG: glycosyltransferase family 2 protein [Halothiobacillaceae bacterium]|nr:glycosyltransferase family 2 protein [Halothiobacillaceae bacterium]